MCFDQLDRCHKFDVHVHAIKVTGCGLYMEAERVKTLEGHWVWPITKGRMGLIDLGVANLWRQNGVKGLTSQKGPGCGQNGVKGFNRQKGPGCGQKPPEGSYM